MKTKIDILYEDAGYVVVDKPAGIMVHGDGKSKEKTLVDWVIENYPETEKVGEPMIDSEGNVIRRPGIVHRLDKDTSGVLVIAKNNEAYGRLKKQFQKHTVIKKYNAFVWGNFSEKIGRIEKPIGRSKNDFRQWSATRGIKGETREAITHYEVLKQGNGFSFVEVQPLTGRTHQIRVHFKAINHPVVNDGLYASEKPQSLGLKRLALHAREIKFENLDKNKVLVKSSLPKEFENALKTLEKAT